MPVKMTGRSWARVATASAAAVVLATLGACASSAPSAAPPSLGSSSTASSAAASASSTPVETPSQTSNPASGEATAAAPSTGASSSSAGSCSGATQFIPPVSSATTKATYGTANEVSDGFGDTVKLMVSKPVTMSGSASDYLDDNQQLLVFTVTASAAKTGEYTKPFLSQAQFNLAAPGHINCMLEILSTTPGPTWSLLNLTSTPVTKKLAFAVPTGADYSTFTLSYAANISGSAAQLAWQG